jgi:undecaprenyl-phosphate 4-deoxy-4-formamido-L-arabinose transferase
MVTPIEISVVVPVYRSEAMLPELVERLSRTLDGLQRTYELIFVDDGSPDGSWAVLERLQAQSVDHVVIVQLMRNFGQQNALMCGFRMCRGRYIVTLDDDLQNPPEEIPKLINVLEARQADVVYGRYIAKQHSVWRNLASAISHSFFEWVFGVKVYASSFRAIRREIIEAVLAYNLNFTMVDGLLAWHTDRIVDEAVEHHPRGNGRSGYSVGRLLVHAINLFTNFSLVPLQLVTLVGFVASMAGIGTAIYFLMQHFFGLIAVPGFASTLIAILVLGGVQLMAIGILGEYLGRVHLNVNRKPQYTVRHVKDQVVLLHTDERSVQRDRDPPAPRIATGKS